MWCVPPPQDAAAAVFLHDEEISEYARIRAPARAGLWLASRVALKLLAWKLLGLQDPRCSWVTKSEAGVPRLAVEDGAGVGTFACSVSHTDGLAVAALWATPRRRVGVDVQKVTPKLVFLSHCFVGESDRLGVPLPAFWAHTMLWACKEAAAKAWGLGLALDFRTTQIGGEGDGRFQVWSPRHGQLKGQFSILTPQWACAVCFDS